MMYCDTVAGAIQCLEDVSDLDLAGAEAYPDPRVSHVWLVVCRDRIGSQTAALVYLLDNDFETVEMEHVVPLKKVVDFGEKYLTVVK